MKAPKRIKLDAETKLLAAMGIYEHMSDTQYWTYYADRARTAREAMQFLLADDWCDGINRRVFEAAVIACALEEDAATEQLEAALRSDDGPATLTDRRGG